MGATYAGTGTLVARCPRCEGSDLEPCAELLEASDEAFRATHECKACGTRFRLTPGTIEYPKRSGGSP